MTVALDKKRFGPWALVTGASSGIGKEFAQQIAASGINIVLVARREDLLKEVGVEFSKRFGVEHRVIVLDVSRNPSENRRFGAEASARDWMVCCAPRIHYPAPNTAPKSGLALRRRNRAQKVERTARKTWVGCTEAWAAVAASGL